MHWVDLMTLGALPLPQLVPGSPERSAELWRGLRALADDLRQSLGSRLEALVLVGGYARGEGGLSPRGDALVPYNDVDLIAVVRGSARALRSKLAVFGHTWSARIGVDVDLWPVSASAIRRPPRTLFWLDVALGGGRVVAGDSDVVNRLAFSSREVPLEEATRLLANRAVGLALSNLEASPDDATRPLRHVHKAVLACGDALLLAADRYRPRVRLRMRELARLAEARPELVRLSVAYREAARFRLRPDLWRAPADLDVWYRARVREIAEWHLSFEHWRCGAPRDPMAYAGQSTPIYASLPDVTPASRLAAALRSFLSRAAPMGVVHPRERLARVAVLLAYAAGEPLAEAHARSLLGLPVTASSTELRAALLRLSALGG